MLETHVQHNPAHFFKLFVASYD